MGVIEFILGMMGPIVVALGLVQLTIPRSKFHKIRRRRRRHRFDLTRNRKLVRHDRERHRLRIDAEDRWLAEWVLLLGSTARLSEYDRHQLLYPKSYPNADEELMHREAERARINEMVAAHQQAQRTKQAILLDRAKDAKNKLEKMMDRNG